MKLSHVALSVKDLERSQEFYENIFGLKTVWQGEKRESGKKFMFLEDDNGTIIELFQDHNPELLTENLKDTKKIGMKHIAFEVDNIESFLAEAERFPINKITEIKKGTSVKRYIFITDPDNIPIELFEK